MRFSTLIFMVIYSLHFAYIFLYILLQLSKTHFMIIYSKEKLLFSIQIGPKSKATYKYGKIIPCVRACNNAKLTRDNSNACICSPHARTQSTTNGYSKRATIWVAANLRMLLFVNNKCRLPLATSFCLTGFFPFYALYLYSLHFLLAIALWWLSSTLHAYINAYLMRFFRTLHYLRFRVAFNCNNQVPFSTCQFQPSVFVAYFPKSSTFTNHSTIKINRIL